MIERKKKPCKACGTETYIWARGMCKTCSAKSSKPKPARVPKGKTKKGSPKPTGELALFIAIWKTRPHVCQVSGKPIREFNVSCFMHILSKKAYPKYRLYDKNILLVLPEVHHRYDFGARSAPEFERVRELHDNLINQYYNN